MRITMIQTSDPVRYAPMLATTARINRLYADLHGYEYVQFVGLKKGLSPIHATYNRIFMLEEMLHAGHDGWVVYVDADAFVSDVRFDLRRYLIENAKHDFIAMEAPIAEPWAINAGIFMVNLGTEIGRKIVLLYRLFADTLVPDAYWNDPQAGWAPPDYDDQNMLLGVLGRNADILGTMKKARREDFRFFRQVLRVDGDSLEHRISIAAVEIDRLFLDLYASIARFDGR